MLGANGHQNNDRRDGNRPGDGPGDRENHHQRELTNHDREKTPRPNSPEYAFYIPQGRFASLPPTPNAGSPMNFSPPPLPLPPPPPPPSSASSLAQSNSNTSKARSNHVHFEEEARPPSQPSSNLKKTQHPRIIEPSSAAQRYVPPTMSSETSSVSSASARSDASGSTITIDNPGAQLVAPPHLRSFGSGAIPPPPPPNPGTGHGGEIPFIRACYCGRCMFWLAKGWMDAEAGIQNISFQDPHTKGLDVNGRDPDGHFRINSFLCPICMRERLIVNEASGDQDKKRRFKSLDELLYLWTKGKLIKGMAKEAMAVKQEYQRDDTAKEEWKKKKAEKKAKKAAAAASAGTWMAITAGLLFTSEILSHI